PAFARLAAGEAQLGMALGVEEIGRLKVGLEVLVLDLDRADLRRAGELAVGDGRLEGLQLAAEGRDAQVLDGEADARVDGIGLPGAGREVRLLLVDNGAHEILASTKVDDANNGSRQRLRAQVVTKLERGLTPFQLCYSAIALPDSRSNACRSCVFTVSVAGSPSRAAVPRATLAMKGLPWWWVC